jgi:hypothetical protein
MPELHETRMGRSFFERDVPAIARALARIADALERLAEQQTTTSEPAEGEDPRGAGVDEPRDPGA